jgi:hypothetical protein
MSRQGVEFEDNVPRTPRSGASLSSQIHYAVADGENWSLDRHWQINSVVKVPHVVDARAEGCGHGHTAHGYQPNERWGRREGGGLEDLISFGLLI